MDRKTAFIGIGFLILAGLGLAFLVNLSKSQDNCKLQEKIVISGKEPVVASADLRALVKFQGYLELVTDASPKENLLPLALESVRIDQTQHGETKIKIDAQCAKMELEVVKSTMQVHVIGLEVNLKSTNKLKNQSCKLKSANALDAPAGMHSRCKDRYFECYSKGPTENDKLVLMAKLYLKVLEFELDGDRKSVGQGKFSTKAQECALADDNQDNSKAIELDTRDVS